MNWKQAFALGLIAPGFLGEKVTAKFKLGSLRCNAMLNLFPANYKHTNTWAKKTWNVNNSRVFMPQSNTWSDGVNIFYSDFEDQFILDGDTWKAKTWKGLTEPQGARVWTDGKNSYCVENVTSHYVLNGDTWEPKVWSGCPEKFSAVNVWSDGTNVYYTSIKGGSLVAASCVLNGDTWEPKVWNGLEYFYGENVWSDGTHIYHTYNSVTHVLNGDTWEPKTFKGETIRHGEDVWTDGKKIYYSRFTDDRFVLNGDTWEPMAWSIASDVSQTTMYGSNIWSDGTNIYWDAGAVLV